MKRTTVSVCMIVKDGAQTIERAIASCRPWVDEICVSDTGSTDGTLELLALLACEPGAPIRVEQHPWPCDFAAARETSFAMASTEYATWLDDDEILEGGQHLRRLLVDVDVLYVRRRDEVGDDELAHLWDARVVRREAGIRWHGRVHEHLLVDHLEHARWRVAPPLELRVVHRRAAVPGRHRYREAFDAAFAAGDRRLVNYVAGALIGDGEIERATRLLDVYVRDFDGDERFSAIRQESLLLLAVCHELRRMPITARRLRAEHARIWAEWQEAALAGDLGEAGRLSLTMDRLNADDDPALVDPSWRSVPLAMYES